MKKVYKFGVIGYGHRLESVFKTFRELWQDWEVSAIADINLDGVKKRMEDFPEFFAEDCKLYTNEDEMLEKEEFDGILIGTTCSAHTEMAIKALPKNVPIFLEKPVSINREQLDELDEASKKYPHRVVVSFPLRFADLAQLAKELIDDGKIGEVLQVDAYNDVPYGRVYFHNWYRDSYKTGGMWLQKATHDFDYLNYILGQKALTIGAMNVRKLFGGDMPEDAKCEGCEKYTECPESPFVVKNVYKDPYGVPGPWCAFSKQIDNDNCATAIVKYESGTILNYNQNFFARMSAARRGARFYGYKGTLEFDWYTNELKIFNHMANRVDTYKLETKGDHFGGDMKLAKLFMDLLKGKTNESYLDQGIESARMCLAATESCENGNFVKLR